MRTIEFKVVKNDTFGNPRMVCHFSELLTEEERKDMLSCEKIANYYSLACARAVKIGGRRYTGKDYGGGIAFKNTFNKEITERINKAVTETVCYKYADADGNAGYKDFLRIDVSSEKNAGMPKRSFRIDGVLYSRIS